VEILKVGIVGLGRMGNGIAQRLVERGHEVIGYDVNRESLKEAHKVGVQTVASLEELAFATRVIWLMVPVGKIVDDTIGQLLPHMKGGDIVVDGGNSKFADSIRRAQMLATQDIAFLDCGTSGGLAGRDMGYCLMVGGDEAAYTKIHSVLVDIAAPGGLGHIGPSGSGHYVKMVHNGIEYGLLQAYAEGFQLMRQGSFKDSVINLEQVAGIWQNGSIIRSFLVDLSKDVFEKYGQNFTDVVGKIAEGGTGRWTVEDAQEHDIPVPVIEESLKVREWSRETGGNYATKMVQLLREAFGGHLVEWKKEPKKQDEV